MPVEQTKSISSYTKKMLSRVLRSEEQAKEKTGRDNKTK